VNCAKFGFTLNFSINIEENIADMLTTNC